uniref:DUF8077 domain-containing protein n=1 Tax=Meloidogyne enterolobii TaxID=390850 RepID=A0A6V7UWE3_MELEN|nr:unnamed protein product [Meloidogyne enterolobii]
MYFKIIFLITLIVLIKFCCINGQVALGGQQSDRTQQELALLGWTSGVRMAYCQQIAVIDLVDPFREAIARMLNRHCRTPTVCGIKKSVTFNKFQVVMLDSFPRRENRALNFRFYVVLPHDAIPVEKGGPEKPMIPSLVLSDMLNSQLSELTHGLGWQIISHEQYPRFDPTTSFFNRFLIPIAIIMGLCMIFLAYWVSLLTSGSSLYANGWLVRGSSGGKNAALRRTMQIIEEQKYRFALYDSQTGGAPLALGLNPVAPKAVVIYKTNARVQEVHAPPKSLATSSSSPKAAEMGRAMPIYPAPERVSQQQMVFRDKKASKEGPRNGGYIQQQVSSSEILPSPNQAVPMRRKQQSQPVTPAQTTTYDEKEMAELADCVPEIVVVSHPRDSSMDTVDSSQTGRKLSWGQGHRRTSRRFSFGEEFKRRKSFFPGGRSGNKGNQQDRQKRWKASSIALSKFSIVGSRK